ncbi:uncharacterized protein [Lolium perenne]|uniref:uncharacterized protein n=1 Tax=Lolium perenne TaxID=4522 RepID=UPI0021F606A4|nr:uncharacterized protein LOC127305246 [Lolium perenne]XP_051191610.1 uncharacterized protein LOC127305246 [Lolium perenne]
MSETPITYEELPEEHKKKYDEIKAAFESDLIGSFERARKHGVRWKGFSPEGVLDEIDLSVPSKERTRALRQEVNYMVAHSLHRHFESLVNAFERVAVRVVQEIMKHQYSPSGPAIGDHQGEIPFQTRPQLPFALAAPEPPGSPAYVVYKIGGDPGDYQFLQEPPKEIPHGYVCTYVPDCTNLACTNQIATGGISGTDADKHAWLAKYATGTSHENSAPAANTMEQISTMLRDQFGILPKRRTIGYSKPYPNEYDLIPLPPKYRLPEFSNFNGSEGSSSIEHVSRYLAQLGMISASDPLRVRFFAQSLTGPAFGWYTSLQQIQPGRVPEFCGPLPEGPGPTSSSGSLPALHVARRCSPVSFGRQHILPRPVGPSTSTASTSAAEMSEAPITYEELPEEHKKKYDEIKAAFESDLIGSFEGTRKHGVRDITGF